MAIKKPCAYCNGPHPTSICTFAQPEPSYEEETLNPMAPRKLFDITCTIGSVYQDENGMPARYAAFLLIAEHGADGTYEFPNEDGSINHITVETLSPK